MNDLLTKRPALGDFLAYDYKKLIGKKIIRDIATNYIKKKDIK